MGWARALIMDQAGARAHELAQAGGIRWVARTARRRVRDGGVELDGLLRVPTAPSLSLRLRCLPFWKAPSRAAARAVTFRFPQRISTRLPRRRRADRAYDTNPPSLLLPSAAP
jgi:hypothetical protein